MNKKIVLSGAISGHEEEAAKYFIEAEEAVRARYPTAEVFNPIKLPRLDSWEKYMVIRRMRVSGWATDIVYILNDYYLDSRGSQEERYRAKVKGLDEHIFKNKVLADIPKEEVDA